MTGRKKWSCATVSTIKPDIYFGPFNYRWWSFLGKIDKKPLTKSKKKSPLVICLNVSPRTNSDNTTPIEVFSYFVKFQYNYLNDLQFSYQLWTLACLRVICNIVSKGINFLASKKSHLTWICNFPLFVASFKIINLILAFNILLVTIIGSLWEINFFHNF